MKKLLYMAVAAIAALSSCTSNDVLVNENQNENNKVEAPVFTATIEGEVQTRTQLVEGSTAGKLTKVNWESGDEVKMVFGNSGAMDGEASPVYSFPVYQATPSAEDASTATLTIKEGETYNSDANILLAAVYPASIVTDDMKFVFPATQKYQGDGKIGFAPMLAMILGTSIPKTLPLGNACALLEITIPYTQMTSVRSITVSSDLQMNGEVTPCTNGAFYFSNPSNPGSGENQVTLDCYSLNNANVAIPEGGSKTFYVSIVPSGETSPLHYLKYLQIDVTDGNITKTMRTKTFEGTQASGIEIKKNTIYPITFAKNYDPNLLAGEFTVSAGADGIAGTADDKKVKFTKGNLWCNASVSTATFGFEEHQYDFPTSYPTLSGTGLWSCDHVGHFFWKKWEVYSSTATNAYRDMPYYATYGNGELKTSDVFWCGEAHPLEVAGTQGLYVLSADEWNYLLDSENSGGGRSGNRYALAKYKDKYGIIIFPDGYTGITSGDGIGEVNNAWNERHPSANISDETWTALEAAGVVFLPAAGYRIAEKITGGYCSYWASTPFDGTSKDKPEKYAYRLYVTFTSTAVSLWSKGNEDRGYGSSIRLVKTVE